MCTWCYLQSRNEASHFLPTRTFLSYTCGQYAHGNVPVLATLVGVASSSLFSLERLCTAEDPLIGREVELLSVDGAGLGSSGLTPFLVCLQQVILVVLQTNKCS